MNSGELTSVCPDKYIDFLDQIKSDIQQTQLRTAVSITYELTQLYWRIGIALSKKVSEEKWGSKIIERFANDISYSISNSSGFSHRNLKFMRQFAESYPDGIGETAVSQIPWGHNMVLLQKVNNTKECILRS